MTSPSSFKWFKEIEDMLAEQRNRIAQLEKHIHYPHSAMRGELRMKETANITTRMQELAMKEASVDTAPMRSDVEAILTMTAFCKRLLDHHDLAYAVTLEVRNEARRALGLKEREV